MVVPFRAPKAGVSRCPGQAAPRPAPAVPFRSRVGTVRVCASATQQEALPTEVLTSVAVRIRAAGPGKDRLKALLEAAAPLPRLAAADKTLENRVMGCTSQVWVTSSFDAATGTVSFRGDSDSEVSRAVAAVLCSGLSGLTPEGVLALDGPDLIRSLGLDSSAALPVPSRSSGAMNVLETVRKRARACLPGLAKFPSLLITAEGLEPQGTFAEAQSRYLKPDPAQVAALASVLREKKIGVVAHFYMDPEVQGVLASAAESWPHIHVSDSLVMADRAVKMAESGCERIVVLGVDFMSENVRAILDEAGHASVPVYRMDPGSIGCSLAEAAESSLYDRYLEEAARHPSSVHVVYINTSLKTKAYADAKVPTITCTSSNVVQTVLQAFAQLPDCNVWYGPDTYMGRNLAQLFSSLAQASDDEVRAIHPAHTQATIRSLLPRLRYFNDGTCMVHHLFGGEVCREVRESYGDAFLTAHFEVPGEMFSLAMEAQRDRGMGVVGSTQNILDFIAAKVSEATARDFPDRLQFVLGTETGMVTSIVRRVQALLKEAKEKRGPAAPAVEVEIVFPVSSQAVTTQSTATAQLPGGLAVVPGPAGGEGCSAEGGCASCPYMKMNSLSALMGVCNKVGTPAEALLAAYEPKKYSETVGGKSMAKAGCRPILHMRDFQQGKRLSEDLVQDIITRNAH